MYQELPPTFILFLDRRLLELNGNNRNTTAKTFCTWQYNHTRSIAMTNFPSASLEQCTEFDKLLLTITFIAALIAVYNFIIQQQKSKLDVAEKKKED